MDDFGPNESFYKSIDREYAIKQHINYVELQFKELCIQNEYIVKLQMIKVCYNIIKLVKSLIQKIKHYLI